METGNYGSKINLNCNKIVYFRSSNLLNYLFLVLLINISTEFDTMAQDKYDDKKGVPTIIYDDIPVHVIVEGVGRFYLDVIYTNTEIMYVKFEDLFKTLKIPFLVSLNGDSIVGFIENENKTYSVNYNTGQIHVGDKIIKTKDGLIKDMDAIFMESSLFTEAFGITLNFNFRTLTIVLKSNFELPIIKQKRLEKLRNNISKLKGEIVADTVLKRNYHVFKFGAFDWSLASIQVSEEKPDFRFRLGMGTELLYGEADVSIDYYDKYKFDNRQFQYFWRWIDNDKKIIKQAQVGKIPVQSIAFINSPIIGAVVRNAPTIIRKASGDYTISDYTEPNWTVELYINNVLVDYTKADASGLYVFKVPIVYGYTTLKFKFYGPLGEERTEERILNTPYTIMPANEFEYGISTGVLQDSSLSRFGKVELNYGISRRLTVGGGLEYLSSIPNGAFIPYAKASFQPFSKLTINGEYAHGVKTKALLNYYFTKSILLEIDYSKYVEGQQATFFNAPEERKAKLSLPFRIKKLNGYARLEYAQLIYKAFTYNQNSMILSAYYGQFSTNLSTQVNWIDQKTPYISSDLAFSYRIKGYVVRGSGQYNLNEGKFNTYKVELEKRFSVGYLSAAYQRNITYRENFVNVIFKYDLHFAKANISASYNGKKLITAESAQGSLAFGGGNNYVYLSNNSSISKGGILLYPYLDLNNNGVLDNGERLVKINSVRTLGGKVIINAKDSIIRIVDLNAFTNYMVELSDKDLDNIAWHFKNKVYQVLIDPNQFKRVDVPVNVVAEVSGMTYIDKDSSLKGIGRIKINIYNKKTEKLVVETFSESDGYIYYLGLETGEYFAQVDSVQLNNLNYQVEPSQIMFTINAKEEGDIIEGIDFILTRKQVIETQIEKRIKLKGV